MTLSSFLRVLRRQAVIVIALTVIGAAGGIIYALVTPPRYQATTEVMVSVNVADDATPIERSQSTSYATQAMTTYQSIITSALVLDPVIDDLGLETTTDALASSVSAAATINSTIMRITVSSANPGQAARIANAIGDSFADAITNTLEKRDQATRYTFDVVTLQQAQVPTSPAAPNFTTSLALGTMLGLAAGIGLAVLRAGLDTRVRTTDELDGATDAPVLATIPFDDDAERRPLVVVAEPRSSQAEAYRTLRTNTRFLTPDRSTGVFVVTSCNPAEGKSTVAANLAIAAAESGQRVALLDADMRAPRIASYFGIEGSIGLSDVLAGRLTANDALQRWGRGTLFILPAGTVPPNPAELLGSMAMTELMAALRTAFDLIVIDAPPVLYVTDAAVAAREANGVLLVAAAGSTTAGALTDAAARVASADARVLGTVLTMAPTKGADKTAYGAYAYGAGSGG